MCRHRVGEQEKSNGLVRRTWEVVYSGGSSEIEVTRGKTSIGKDGGFDPGQEIRDAGVHIGQILHEEF